MFTASNTFIEYLKSSFPEASDFRFDDVYYQPKIEYYDGPYRRVEYVPVLRWKVKGVSYCWAPTPTFTAYWQKTPMGSNFLRTQPNYNHAYSDAYEVIELTVKHGKEAIDEYNRTHISSYARIQSRQDYLA